MSADMESLGIIFDLQWKKKPGGNNREDVASIGIWDTPDASLDWMTFKSYVCQNLGTMEEKDIYVTYVDSDGDELPIESECEFQEALKFARQRASKGREVILKVDKREGSVNATQSAESVPKETRVPKLMTDKERDLKKKSSKINSKSASKMKSGDKSRSVTSHTPQSNGKLSAPEEKKLKSEDHSLSNELGRKLACIMKLEPEKRKKVKVEKDDAPPTWFKKYMQKFKSDIVAEVTANVLHETKQIVENAKLNSHHPKCYSCCERSCCSTSGSKNKKKKTSDEDSSDGALSSDQRDHKLLKKIEKLHKREKKLEKKLDSKLEKLENKTKRRMEKKIQNKSCSEITSEKKPSLGSRKRMSDGPVGTYLMDAIPLNDGFRPTEIHIRLGERYTKVWEIMNNGILPWTDKTELRLAWGTSGLEPEATILKCPILMPGEKGIIAVTFRAPEFPGTFESYWHFYHMGDRFGHWLGCAVIVDSKEPVKVLSDVGSATSIMPESQNESGVENDREAMKNKTDQPVDLRMKCDTDKGINSSVPKTPLVLTDEAEVDDTCDGINEIKEPPAEAVGTESQERDAEYESDSDDDNLSVISGTISLTSDSEEDENFVVIPMPPCFMCDVPLETADKLHFQEFKRDVHDAAHDELREDLTEVTSSCIENITSSVNVGSGSPSKENKSNSEAESKSIPPMNKETSFEDTPFCERSECEYFMPSRSEVYAVDMAGHCMPVGVPWPNPNNNNNNNTENERIHTYVGNSNTNEEPGNATSNDDSRRNASKPNSGPHSKQEKRGETKHEHSNKARASFHAHTKVFTQSSSEPFRMSFSSTHANGGGKPSESSYNCHTKSSTKTQNGFQHQENCTASSNPTQPSAPNQPQDPLGAAVHILPETLVNGAINVASQAITTAKAVLNNLRSRPSEEFTEWNWNDNAPNWPAQTDRSTTESLNLLLEMGFTNKILNVLLLQRYDNDIAKVVAELLTYKDNPDNRQSP